MQPSEQRSWQIGPLVINKRRFKRGDESYTQWSFEMEGVLAVVSEGRARMVIEGVGMWFDANSENEKAADLWLKDID